MTILKKKLLFFVWCSIFISGCASNRAIKINRPSFNTFQIKYLSTYVLPHNIYIDSTLVGGLSGLDYDAENRQFYLISDDPSQYSAARFYTANIGIKDNKIDTISFTSVQFLKQSNQQTYPKFKRGKKIKADAESIRYHPKDKTLVWSNEGERLFNTTDTTLVQPAVNFIGLDGRFLDSLKLPEAFKIYKSEAGVRKNAFFEGLSYDPGYRYLFCGLEEPLYQDGEIASFDNPHATTRLLKVDLQTKKVVAQYAYPLDALPVKPLMNNDWNTNGISEILALDDENIITIERAWAKGYDEHTFVKIYLVNLHHAENENDNLSFKNHHPKLLKKKLIFDFDTLKQHIDNIEGVSFGPKLSNGHQSLIFCVDNNFTPKQVQQFFLFEIVP